MQNAADDDELLRRCQQGDDTALTQVVERYEGRIFRLALRVLQDSARAEDAATDALATVWLRCRSWRGESRAGTWIQQVAWRVVLDHHRRRKRWWRFWGRTDTAADSDPAALVAAEEGRTNRQRLLAEAIKQLSPEDRALVQLHYFEDQSLAEIALVLQVSRDALKMRLSRARQQLRTLLEDEHERE